MYVFTGNEEDKIIVPFSMDFPLIKKCWLLLFVNYAFLLLKLYSLFQYLIDPHVILLKSPYVCVTILTIVKK